MQKHITSSNIRQLWRSTVAPITSTLPGLHHFSPDYTAQAVNISDETTNCVPAYESVVSIQPEPQYQTVWGSLTFTQLHEQTCRYAAYLLREDPRYGVNDVDDGLQVAYLKLWERLQQEPTLLVGRSIGWIGKFLFYSAVHTRQNEQRRAKRQVETCKGETDMQDFADNLVVRSGTMRWHSHESRQADKRIDLHAAIVSTANYILEYYTGVEQYRALWALYGMTALDIQVTAASQLFGVHHRAMKKAYKDVRTLLKQHLDGYKPLCTTRPIRAKAQTALPYQDIYAIRQSNAYIEPEYFDKVEKVLNQQCPDTLERDLIALQGINEQVCAKAQARIHAMSYSSMQRAYERIHLLLASQKDETITPRRPQKIRAKPFVYRPEYEPLIQLLAQELLVQPYSDGKLIALYSYLCNISNRTSARNFQMSESTLRNYRHQIQARFIDLIDMLLPAIQLQ
jgi:hypothetical protein